MSREGWSRRRSTEQLSIKRARGANKGSSCAGKGMFAGVGKREAGGLTVKLTGDIVAKLSYKRGA